MKQYTFIKLSDRLAIKADPYQWMICKRKGDRWIPKTFHITLEDALTRVQDSYFREAKAKSFAELIEAISQHNAHLSDVVSKSGLTREITR